MVKFSIKTKLVLDEFSLFSAVKNIDVSSIDLNNDLQKVSEHTS